MAEVKLRDDLPEEQEAVRTTIVGGRPPGPGKKNDSIPRGMEVLIKKAAVDTDFYDVLLDERSKAARRIGLELDPSEAMMLDGIPEEQLITIIGNTRVKDRHIPAFMGYAAAAMLAAVGFVTASCNEDDHRYETKGIDPDTGYLDESEEEEEEEIVAPTGIRPDLEYMDEGEETEGDEAEDSEDAEGTAETEGVEATEEEESPGEIHVSRGMWPDIPKGEGE
ncbi:MAG: hypothetical protein GY771_17525 [bacterium]|nr:hypothetical protein [bacterium]